MKINSIFKLILPFVIFIIAILSYINFYIDYNKNKFVKDVHHSIERRLQDYEAVFSIWKKRIRKEEDRKALFPYSHQQIYIKGERDIILGEMEYKAINISTGEEMPGWKSSNDSLQNNLLFSTDVALISAAYSSFETGEELAVDIGYSFDSNNHKFLFKTAIFLQDLFSYKSLPILFISKSPLEGSDSFLTFTYYHSDLEVYIGSKLNSLYLIGSVLIFTLLYCIFWCLIILKRQRNLNKQQSENIKEREIKEKYFDSLNIGKIFEFKYDHPITLVRVSDVVKRILNANSDLLNQKLITFNFEELNAQPIIISTKEDNIYTFLSLYINYLIHKVAEESHIACKISIDHESQNSSIACIKFEDGRTFSSNKDDKFFSSNIKLHSSLEISMQQLMKSIGVYARPSIISHLGSQTTIAIPYLDNSHKKIKSGSNVVPFLH